MPQTFHIGITLAMTMVLAGRLTGQEETEVEDTHIRRQLVQDWGTPENWSPLISPLLNKVPKAVDYAQNKIPPERDPLRTIIKTLNPIPARSLNEKNRLQQRLQPALDHLAAWEIPTVRVWLLPCPRGTQQQFPTGIIPPMGVASLIKCLDSDTRTISADVRLGNVHTLARQTPHRITVDYDKQWTPLQTRLIPVKANTFTGFKAQITLLPSIHGGYFYQLRLERTKKLRIRLVETGLPFGATELPRRDELHIQSSGRIPPGSGIILHNDLGAESSGWILALSGDPVPRLLRQHQSHLPAGELLAPHGEESHVIDGSGFRGHRAYLWTKLESGDTPLSPLTRAMHGERESQPDEPSTESLVNATVLRSLGFIPAAQSPEVRANQQRHLQQRAREFSPSYRLQWSSAQPAKASQSGPKSDGSLMTRAGDLFTASAAQRTEYLFASEIDRFSVSTSEPGLYSRDAYCGSVLTGRIQPLSATRVLVHGTWFVQRSLGEPVLKRSGLKGLANIEHWNMSQARQDGHWVLPLGQWKHVHDHPEHPLWLRVALQP